jgi:hypothetical protein
MIAKTLFFAKTFQRIRWESFVRRKVFVIMKAARMLKFRILHEIACRRAAPCVERAPSAGGLFKPEADL